jgi:hypothetical protein
MPRQLNIRSDEAYELAHDRAKRSGKTIAEVVTDALRVYPVPTPTHGRDEDIPVPANFSPEQAQRHRDTLRWIESIQKYKRPGASSNHDWLYDEFGLPK